MQNLQRNNTPDLIWRVDHRSDGSDLTRVTAAAELIGKPIPAAALRGGSPEFAKSGTLGVLSGGAWLGREYAR